MAIAQDDALAVLRSRRLRFSTTSRCRLKAVALGGRGVTVYVVRILPAAFLKSMGIEVKTKYGTA